MRKLDLALVLFFSSPLAARAELTIEGGNVKTVKVDQVVTIKVDRTVVSSFPFKIKAPKGGFGYTWQYPTGVTAKAKASVLEVSASPTGDMTVAVSYTLIDFKKETTEDKYEELSFSVGEPGPGPQPQPVDAFTKSLQDAYNLETDKDRAKYLANFLALFQEAPVAADNPAVKTYGDLFGVLKKASLSLLPAEALPKVRAIVTAELNAALGTNAALAIDRDLTKKEFTKIAKALGGIK